MEAKELRVGNWVNPLNPIQVEWNDLEIADTLEPILITEEWLTKFGFGKLPTGSYPLCMQNWCKSDSKNNSFIIETGSRGFILRGRDFFLNKYVHQLQNIYYVLTGEELECKQ